MSASHVSQTYTLSTSNILVCSILQTHYGTSRLACWCSFVSNAGFNNTTVFIFLFDHSLFAHKNESSLWPRSAMFNHFYRHRIDQIVNLKSSYDNYISSDPLQLQTCFTKYHGLAGLAHTNSRIALSFSTICWIEYQLMKPQMGEKCTH